MKDKVIFILGPTAVGKTEISVNLAKAVEGEIISADSVQIFKGLDIGSAKVTKKEMQNIVHHAIDMLQPDEEFSAYDYVNFTKQKIKEICQRGKVPIIVGGTGLYVKALTLGYNFGGAPKDDELRKKLEALLEEKGKEHLFEMLKKKSSTLAESTDIDNPVRLVRNLEIALQEGEKTVSETEIEPLVFALNLDREQLYLRINNRVDKMFESGLVDEVKSLQKQGLTSKNQSMRAIGYKEVLAYLDGEISLKKMIELVKQHSRNYAKRQLTFLRSMQNVVFVDVKDKGIAYKKVLDKTLDFLKK